VSDALVPAPVLVAAVRPHLSEVIDVTKEIGIMAREQRARARPLRGWPSPPGQRTRPRHASKTLALAG
jgi:hypothetical protein